MDAIKELSERELKDIAFVKDFPELIVLKDYRLTCALYLLCNIKNCYFKGGTALQKIFLNHSRLSEDIDYTVTKNLEAVKKEIIDTLDKSNLFTKLELDKNNDFFTRIICHYTTTKGVDDTIFIDLNKKAKIITPPEEHYIKHFYNENIPSFIINTLSEQEMIAEKVAAAVGRNKPRDHFDIYQIIKQGHLINYELVAKKCENNTFDVVKMFNKAKRLKNRWDDDMHSLINEPVSFQEVMQVLAEHFDLKGAKEVIRIK